MHGKEGVGATMGQEQSTTTLGANRVQVVSGSGASVGAREAAEAAADEALLGESTRLEVPRAHHRRGETSSGVGVGGGGGGEGVVVSRTELAAALGAMFPGSIEDENGGGELKAVLEVLDGGGDDERARSIVERQKEILQQVNNVYSHSAIVRRAVEDARVGAIAVARLSETLDRLSMDTADVLQILTTIVQRVDGIAQRHFSGDTELRSFAAYINVHPPDVQAIMRRQQSQLSSSSS